MTLLVIVSALCYLLGYWPDAKPKEGGTSVLATVRMILAIAGVVLWVLAVAGVVNLPAWLRS